METKNTNGAHVQNGIAKDINNKAAANGVAVKGNGIHPKKDAANNRTEAENPKDDQVKNGQSAVHHPEPKPEESKSEAIQMKEEAQPATQALSLEFKLKAVDTLHRKSIQRLNLISRLKQIEAFEVALAQESDELEDNPYQGCKLIIEDDKKRQFVTTTPGLIRLVSQFIFSACHEKLAEIEASIVFPNA